MSLSAGTRIGSYEVIATIGAGGMGEVYRAHDRKLHRDVALKILPDVFAADPDRLARFEREAHVLASLNHPNIAAIHGLEDSNGVRALVMELVEGETLADRIARGPIPLGEAVPVARQIAEAVEAAHEQGIVHRDLKPANIKVRADGTVKVLDFGLAKLAGPTASGAGVGASISPTITSPAMMTGVGILLGTAAYMSPEQANGRDADKRSDVWAFGCVLYEMLTGQRPFAGETIAETLASVIKEQPSLDRVPPTVRPLVGRCLEKNPRLRLQAVGEARIALDRSADQSIAAPTPRPHVVSRRVWLPWSIAAVAAAIAAVAVVASLTRRTDPLPVLRYTVAGPADGVMNSFALSPDGRSIAMAATVAGKRQLWLRALDGFQVRPLANTDDAAFPFWSPDGKQIAFFAQGKLKRIAVSGGPAQALCNVGEGRAGAWGSDGNILFTDAGPVSSGPASANIQRVSAQGGAPVAVLKTAGTAISLVLLPDDRRFLYAMRDATQWRGVFMAATDGTGNHRILDESPFAAYAPYRDTPDSGHLLFIRDETLMAQPFDAASGSLSGDAVPISDGVLIPARGPYTPVTVSNNGVMVYARSGDAETPTRIVWFDRTGNLTELKDVLGSSPTLSPDGRSLAYMRAPNGRSQVWVRDLASGREIRLTQEESRTTTPQWSPDGQRLVFRSERGGKPGDLYWRAANGAGRDEPLLETPNNKIPTQWSRDGKYIVYSQTRGPNFGLSVLEVAAGRVAAAHAPMPFLSDASDLEHGQLSPDNRWMAYVAREGGRQEVFVRPFPAVGEDLWKVSTEGGLQPRWRADGKELYFLSVDGKMMAAPVGGAEPSNAQKRGQRFEVGVPVPLFDTHTLAGTTSRAYQYDVTGDGSRFIVATTGSSTAPILTVEVNWNTPVK